MAANYFPTLGAFPSFLFPAKKLLNTILRDVFKVLNHAHPKMNPVPSVEFTEVFTWAILEFITVLYLSTQE